jgi:hypothetical protein
MHENLIHSIPKESLVRQDHLPAAAGFFFTFGGLASAICRTSSIVETKLNLIVSRTSWGDVGEVFFVALGDDHFLDAGTLGCRELRTRIPRWSGTRLKNHS